jgi:hypothetical protein
MNRDGLVTLPTPDRRALEAELKIVGGPEADLLDVYPWIARIDYVRLSWVEPSGFDGLGI